MGDLEMGMIDSIKAGYAQGKREAEEEAIVKRHMREREKRKAALKPSTTAKKIGKAAQKLKPVGSAVSSSAKKLHEWNESHPPGGSTTTTKKRKSRKKSAGAKKKKTTKKISNPSLDRLDEWSQSSATRTRKTKKKKTKPKTKKRSTKSGFGFNDVPW